MRKVRDYTISSYSSCLYWFIVFIRQALFDSRLRLDGRNLEDIRAISVKLTRTETSCSSEIQWGHTMVAAVISCKIIAPFPERPNEGVLHFNSELSAQAEVSGYSNAEISRMLEKSIRESETLDTESLCIVNGEKVWEIRCEIRIIDASGGNIIDAAILAAISALKGFRKPEISIITTELVSQNQSKTKLHIHHSDERDPLPLALHHTPLSLSVGIARRGGHPQSGEKMEVRYQ
jgi:exosome complex component RRP45